MTRLLTCGALVVYIVAAASTFGAAGTAAQQPVFRGRGDAVRLFVTVTDRDGRLVTSLTQADFEIRDEGDPQPITLFDNSPQPIRLILMLDVSGSMQGNLPLLRAAADELVARLLPDDLARVGTFGQAIDISPEFTRDPHELRTALPDAILPDAPTPLWSALDEAMDAFGDEGDERRVILLLSDGNDSGPAAPTSFGQPVASQAGVIDRAREDDVMIYAVGMRSRGPRRNQPGQLGRPGLGRGGLRAMLTADLPDAGLARVAEDTGGGYSDIDYGQDLGAAFARVADELHSQYLIGFAPPERDSKVHDVDVRVNQRGLTPRARKNYVAPTE